MTAWVRGPGTTTTVRRGKDTGQTSTRYQKNYRPFASKKTAVGKKGFSSTKAKTYAAGSNILTREKRLTYDEQLAKGTRADDPRNWEFHYKEPRRFNQPTKGMEVQERNQQASRQARMSAEKKAKWTGEDIYETRKIEYETQGIVGEARQTAKNAKALGRFGSTRVAGGVAAAKQASERRMSRGRARTTGPFDPPTKQKPGALA